MSGHRISRKEIKRNDLAETLSGLTLAAGTHARSVAIAAGAVVLLGVVVSLGFWWSRSRAAEANRQLSAVQHAAGFLLQAAERNSEQAQTATTSHAAAAQDVIAKADALLRDHPSSAAARWATYYKAVGQKEAGDAAGALSTVATLASGSDNDLLTSAARALQAQIREQQGDYAGAVEAYASLAAAPSPSFPAEMALAGQARALDAQGKKDEAAEVRRRLQQEHADSPYARQITQNDAAAPPGT
jgi:hypothetical protein